MKKILFLNRSILLDSLLQSLTKKFEVTYLMRRDRVEKNIPDADMVRVDFLNAPISNFLNKKLGVQTSVPIIIKGLAKILKNKEPDILVAFDIYHWYFLQAVRYKKRYTDTKLYIYSETKMFPQGKISGTIFRFFWWYLRRNMKYIDGIFVFTEQGRRFYTEHLPEAYVTLVPVPVDTERFYPPIEKIWLPNGTPRILMNARYEAYKRHDDLLQALVRLREQDKQFHITCIGRADSGRSRVEARVKELGLTECVTFIDPVPQTELLSIYHQHDVLVLPSYNEAIGMVVPEAMTCGIPTITSDTVGANVYVKEGETGFIFKTYDIDDLTEKLEQCYDPDRLQQMGVRAYEYVKKSFSVAVCSENFSSAL